MKWNTYCTAQYLPSGSVHGIVARFTFTAYILCKLRKILNLVFLFAKFSKHFLKKKIIIIMINSLVHQHIVNKAGGKSCRREWSKGNVSCIYLDSFIIVYCFSDLIYQNNVPWYIYCIYRILKLYIYHCIWFSIHDYVIISL
jgi:hypothetical protein